MNISFGMIFSILLIVFFIAFAFYGIKKFLGFQDTIKIEKFLDDLQSDVDRVWRGSQASQEKNRSCLLQGRKPAERISKPVFPLFRDFKRGQHRTYQHRENNRR